MSVIVNREFIKCQIRELRLIVICGIINGIAVCPSCVYTDIWKAFKIMLVSCFIWFIMWKGNSLTNELVSHYYSWLREPVKRLIFGIIGHCVYTTLAATIIVYGLEYYFSIIVGRMPDTIIISIFFSLVVSTVLHSREFLTSWRRLAVESEQIKKEAAVSKYETLKNQVNPHFLFNSLNALSNLVYENQDLAAKFIKKLSQVYRYVLETREKELVCLSEELEFVKSYIFLQKIRFQDKLVVKIDENLSGKMVVPLAIQMLVENAIKHNEISEERPLVVEIKREGDMLVVENNLQKINIIKEESSEVGLKNIKSRYSFLSEQPVEVEQGKNSFKVSLPLIDK